MVCKSVLLASVNELPTRYIFVEVLLLVFHTKM